MYDKNLVIMDAALRVFLQRGYKAATTKLIAEEAGINESTLFRRFKTKENLFNSVIDYNRDKISKELDLIIPKDLPEDPREQLDLILKAICKVMKRNISLVLLLSHEILVDGHKGNNELFIMIIAKYFQSFKSSDVNLKILALNIFSFFLIINARNINETVDINKNLVFKEFKEYCARILQI